MLQWKNEQKKTKILDDNNNTDVGYLRIKWTVQLYGRTDLKVKQLPLEME